MSKKMRLLSAIVDISIAAAPTRKLIAPGPLCSRKQLGRSTMQLVSQRLATIPA